MSYNTADLLVLLLAAGGIAVGGLPVASLKDYDLRPWVVRDVIAEGQLHDVRHLVELLKDG